MPTHEEAHAAEVKKDETDKAKADKVAEDKAAKLRESLDKADKAKAALDADRANASLKKAHEHAQMDVAKAQEDAEKAQRDADAKVPKQEYLLAEVGAQPEFTLRNGVKVPNPLNETNSVKVCCESVEEAVRLYNVGRQNIVTRKMLRVYDCLADCEVPLVAPVPPAPVMVPMVPAEPVAKK